MNSPVFSTPDFHHRRGPPFGSVFSVPKLGAVRAQQRQMSSVPGSGEYEALEVRNGSRGDHYHTILETEMDVVSSGKLMGFPGFPFGTW